MDTLLDGKLEDARTRRDTMLLGLYARGFDLSKHERGYLAIGCSACVAVFICGHASHETGCPNDTRGCQGCNARVKVGQRYCADCRR